MGNVGIGTDSPTDLLTVAGTANVQSLVVSNDLSVAGTNNNLDSMATVTVTRTIAGNTVGSGVQIDSIGESGVLNETGVCVIDLHLTSNTPDEESTKGLVVCKTYRIPFHPQLVGSFAKRVLPYSSMDSGMNDVAIDALYSSGILTLSLARVRAAFDPDTSTVFQISMHIHYNKLSGFDLGTHWVPSTAAYTSPLVDNPLSKSQIYPGLAISQSSGTVGIMTDDPGATLDVNGNGIVRGNLQVAGTANVQSLIVKGDATFDTNALRVDSGNNRLGVGTTTPSQALDVVGDMNTSGVLRIGGTQVLSSTTLASAVTASSLTSVGTLNDLSVSTAGTGTLGGTVIRSFQKALGGSLAGGQVSEICTITGSRLTFSGHLYVVNAGESGDKTSKVYTLTVSADSSTGGTTSGVWQRLMPVTNVGSAQITETGKPTTDNVAVAINVNTLSDGECKLRLVRKPSTTGFSSTIECVLVLQQSRGKPITITDSSVTATNQTLATNFFRSTLLTQAFGSVGIGTDSPTDLLTVAGTANVQSLIVGCTLTTTDAKTGNATHFTQAGYGTLNFSDKWRLFHNKVDDSLEIQKNTAGTWSTTAVLAT